MQKRFARFQVVGAVAALFLSIDPSLATARYRAIDLNHDEPYGTVVLAVSGGQASGFAIDSYSIGRETRYCRHAVHWASLSATPARLNVLNSSCSDVRGMSDSRQVGTASLRDTGKGYLHAMIWENAAKKPYELSANALGYSLANGIRGDAVVGQASGIATSGHLHAVLWHIGNNAMVDLNGSHHLESAALATNGKQQAGWASDEFGENVHAMLWSGRQNAEVDLNPESFGSSYAYAIDAGSQVGVGLKHDSAHALLWHGNVASAVDLNPAGFVESFATGVSGKMQVGYAIKADLSAHALVWSGGASGTIDLQKFLPPSLTQSYATSIDAEGNIGGYATGADGTPHAVVWQQVRTKTPPVGKLALAGR